MSTQLAMIAQNGLRQDALQERENFSLSQMQDEPLAALVIDGCQQFKRVIPYVIELRRRFQKRPRGKANIAGCKTWEEFCEKRLDRGVRAVQIAVHNYAEQAILGETDWISERNFCPSKKRSFDTPDAIGEARAVQGLTDPYGYFRCSKCNFFHLDKAHSRRNNPADSSPPEPQESNRKRKRAMFLEEHPEFVGKSNKEIDSAIWKTRLGENSPTVDTALTRLREKAGEIRVRHSIGADDGGYYVHISGLQERE